MAKTAKLTRENERNLALLNRSLNNAFNLANEVLNATNEVRRLVQAGKKSEAIAHVMVRLQNFEDLAWKVRGDRKNHHG